ncbi:hypothetical protein D9757_007604 [Collybiopsis confluens]|uniref:Uncharacterized protein n=1 Tax=Collybiopsis confluens TaxID=2823264 RepID=A0A8H5H9C0_9AGAR|nr:hypothetical protein D9757_007604 [Collybiopsis confluens]
MTKLVKPRARPAHLDSPPMEPTKPIIFPSSSSEGESLDEKRSSRKLSLVRVGSKASRVVRLVRKSVSFHGHRSRAHGKSDGISDSESDSGSSTSFSLSTSQDSPSSSSSSPHRHRRISLPSLPAFLHKGRASPRRSSSLALDPSVPPALLFPSALSPILSVPPSAVEAVENGDEIRSRDEEIVIDTRSEYKDIHRPPGASSEDFQVESAAPAAKHSTTEIPDIVLPFTLTDVISESSSVPAASLSLCSASSGSLDPAYNYMDDIDDIYSKSSSDAIVGTSLSTLSRSRSMTIPRVLLSWMQPLRPIPLGSLLTWWLGKA